MQSVTLICLGKLSADFYAKGCAEYEKRLSAFCNFKVIELAEETMDEKHFSAALIEKALEKEAVRILAAVPKNAELVALCVEGKLFSSEGLAKILSENAMHGGNIAFIIGSSHGLHEKVKKVASVRLSISQMTFPHQLCRLIVLEQIYRGHSMNAGTKYHK